ncbi:MULTISPECIES: WXG100 family type VII secretion target [Oryzihumus]|jgi:WXG100 family type VII secretion target|uniref:ESAT-6-like protein n=1 Tax=Oryzihumus leptocrescens TaxID=297536 RepID=A0A542ZH82_9MICO|nr:WXG100 family type VII secretion target [Oryzihumus leptocrescens]TQL59713.1 WXG100 family type VII secretion target [Oryzihumus leptocrescens]HET7661758.1 WXG100 family type VII secretion target [Oryzihumus sp.]
MFKVEFGALQQAAGDIKAGANNIDSKLQQMDQSLAPLRSDWTGSASEAYTQAKAQWTSAIQDMKQLLADIGTAVDASHQDYSEGEKHNTNLW